MRAAGCALLSGQPLWACDTARPCRVCTSWSAAASAVAAAALALITAVALEAPDAVNITKQ